MGPLFAGCVERVYEGELSLPLRAHSPLCAISTCLLSRLLTVSRSDARRNFVPMGFRMLVPMCRRTLLCVIMDRLGTFMGSMEIILGGLWEGRRFVAWNLARSTTKVSSRTPRLKGGSVRLIVFRGCLMVVTSFSFLCTPA